MGGITILCFQYIEIYCLAGGFCACFNMRLRLTNSAVIAKTAISAMITVHARGVCVCVCECECV